MLILLLDKRNESINALGIGHIKLFNMDVGSWVFGEDFITGLIGKFDISASHYDVPVLAFGEMVDDTVSDTLVGSSDDDVSDLVHCKILMML